MEMVINTYTLCAFRSCHWRAQGCEMLPSCGRLGELHAGTLDLQLKPSVFKIFKDLCPNNLDEVQFQKQFIIYV